MMAPEPEVSHRVVRLAPYRIGQPPYHDRARLVEPENGSLMAEGPLARVDGGHPQVMRSRDC